MAIDLEIITISKRNTSGGVKTLGIKGHFYSMGSRKHPYGQSSLNRLAIVGYDGGKELKANIPDSQLYSLTKATETIQAWMINNQLNSGSLPEATYKIMEGIPKNLSEVVDGKNRCYEIEVIFNSKYKYPICMNIKNYYAPVIKSASGQQTIDKKNAENLVSSSFSLSMDEWMNLLDWSNKLSNTSLNFKAMHGQLTEFFTNTNE